MTPEAAHLIKDIAADPRATTEVLQMLWEAGLERSAVLRHPNCPQHILLEVAGAAIDSIQPPSIDQLAAFRHPLCPAELLWRAARSRRPELIAAAAACPDLPAELAAEISGMTSLGSKDLLGAARIEEAKRLAGAGWNVALQKALGDIRVGKQGDDGFDYNHVLSDDQKNDGYSLRVSESRDGPSLLNISANLFHEGKKVGAVQGLLDDERTVEPHADPMHWEHQGKGLGRAMYEAMLAHAKTSTALW